MPEEGKFTNLTQIMVNMVNIISLIFEVKILLINYLKNNLL